MTVWRIAAGRVWFGNGGARNGMVAWVGGKGACAVLPVWA